MVTTRFIGRLGNSMFQVAATMSYAKKYGYEWAVPGDARESAIHRVYPDLPKTGHHFQGYPRNGYDAAHYEYYEWPNWGDNILLQGFFQSEKFFENVKDRVKKTFELPHVPEVEEMVSIHVRRGDFVQHHKSFPPVTARWLEMACNEMWARIPDCKAMVFSDDIQWCRDAMGFDKDFEFFDDPNERTSLAFMASCKHHIIANSTFSWWAAYLGHNPDRIVVCPNSRDWYGTENSVVTFAKSQGLEPCRNLIPNGWIQI